jgi:hypothetical protein
MLPQSAALFYGIQRSGFKTAEHSAAYPVHGGGAYITFPDGLIIGGEGGGGGAVQSNKTRNV